jgi:hypothetical protein
VRENSGIGLSEKSFFQIQRWYEELGHAEMQISQRLLKGVHSA